MLYKEGEVLIFKKDITNGVTDEIFWKKGERATHIKTLFDRIPISCTIDIGGIITSCDLLVMEDYFDKLSDIRECKIKNILNVRK